MSEEYKPSQEKLHYDSLYKLFKNLIWLGGILTIAAGWFIGNSLATIKSDAKDEVAEVKKDIKELEERINITLDQTAKLSSQYLNDVRENTQDFVSHTKYVSRIQLDAIREETKYLALQTAKNKVEEAFDIKNINELIDEEAIETLQAEIDLVINDELDRLLSAFEIFPDFTIAVDQIRAGNSKYIFYLDSIYQNASSKVVQESALKILIQKGQDYKKSMLGRNADGFYSNKTIQSFYDKFNIDTSRLDSRVYLNSRLDTLYEVANKENDDIYEISGAYLTIGLLMKSDSIRFFDLNQLRKIKSVGW